MPIVKIHGMEMDAEILGRVRRVTFAGESLTLHDVAFAEAQTVVEMLSRGALLSAHIPSVGDPVSAPAVSAPVVSVPTSTASDSLTVWDKQAPEDFRPPCDEPGCDEPRAAGHVVCDQHKAPTDANQGALVLAPSPVAELPEERRATNSADSSLQNARKIRDVIGVLADRGFTTPDALVAECRRLRAEVPLLSRISEQDFDDRVRRAAAVCDLPGLGA